MIDTEEQLQAWIADNPVPPGLHGYEEWRDEVVKIFGVRNRTMLLHLLECGNDAEQYAAIIILRVALGYDGYKVGYGGSAYYELTAEDGSKMVVHPSRDHADA